MRVSEYVVDPRRPAGALLPVVLIEPDDLARRALSSLLVANGFQLAGATAKAGPALEILREQHVGVLGETLRAGVSAILSKYTHPQSLMYRLGTVFSRGLLLDEITGPPLLNWLRRETGDFELVLPAREREVLELLLQGHGIRSAANALGLAESTVKNHAAKAAARLGMTSSMPAAREAERRGLLAPAVVIEVRSDANVLVASEPGDR
jgi:DNA-binding CsgD family transcriptional regulator